VPGQHTVLKRGGLYWDRETVPPSVFAERVARIQAEIAKAGDDAWVFYGDSQSYGAPAYVSGFLPRARSVLVLVPRSGEPTLLASVGPRDVPAAKTLTAVEDVRPYVRLPREAIRILMERQLGQKKVGLVGAHAQLSEADWQAISSELPEVRWEQRDAIFNELRASKAPVEQAVISKAGAVVSAGLDAASSALQPGRSVRQAIADVDKAMRYAGAEDLRLLISVGQGALRPAHDGIIPERQPISLLAAAEVQRYWSEAARTYNGDASLASQAVEAMAAAAKPGVTAGAVAEAARAVLSSATGWTATSADDYGLGNGIGLDLEEPPFIRAGSAEPLVSGATLALRVVLPGSIAGRTIAVA